MSKRLESTCHESPQRQQRENNNANNFVPNIPMINSCSPNQAETKRVYFNRERSEVGDSSLDNKQTQRHLTLSILNQGVWLSQCSQSKSGKQSKWSFNYQQEKNKNEVLTKVYNILEQNGIMQAFQSFEVLRNYILQQISDQQNQNLSHFSQKLNLFNLISQFKAKIYFSQNEVQSTKCDSSNHQLQQLLEKVTELRSQNAKLKSKLKDLHLQKNLSQSKDKCNDSIIDNSISFHDESYIDSCHLNFSQYSVECNIKSQTQQIIKPFCLTKQQISQHSSFKFYSPENSFKQDQITNQQSKINNKYMVNSHNQKLIIDTMNQQAQWASYFEQIIEVLHLLFCNQVIAANHAVVGNNNSLRQLSNIVNIYSNYKPMKQSGSILTFMQECNRIKTLIVQLSNKINQLQYSKTNKNIKSCYQKTTKQLILI